MRSSENILRVWGRTYGSHVDRVNTTLAGRRTHTAAAIFLEGSGSKWGEKTFESSFSGEEKYDFVLTSQGFICDNNRWYSEFLYCK